MNVMLDFFFFQAEDGIRDLVRSRGLGDVYKRQVNNVFSAVFGQAGQQRLIEANHSDAADNIRGIDLSLIHI